MTPEELTKLTFKYSEIFERIYVEYLEKMGQHIKAINKLTPSDVHILQQLNRFGANMNEISQLIAEASQVTVENLNKLYLDLVESEYSYAKELYEYAGVVQVPLEANTALQTMVKSISQATAGAFQNLSNTTALSQAYKDAIDKAVIAVSSGISTKEKELRRILNQALNNSKIVYESGYKRRLDSAARMNISEGIRQINIETRKIMGEQYGADGMEISAHALCAPDHLDIQGRQFSMKEYEELNAGLKRPIGTLNCRHFATAIVLGHSSPTYTQKQLEEYKNYSNKKIEIDGKEYSRYECSQLLRNIETETRYTKEKYILDRAAGFTDGQKEAYQHIKELRKKYDSICEKADLNSRVERMYVPNYRK